MSRLPPRTTRTPTLVPFTKLCRSDGRDGPANQNRLCGKGRFGWYYIYSPHRLTKPMIRRDDAPKRWNDQVDPMNPWTHFREATWEEALEKAAGGLKKEIGRANV